ncbi:MAG: Stp1/IreP family PP2C-type Ser/Thr phosphatase [Prolixibacteraceae bacterium]|nr:Stp1/IreP family PP2C-type Ser/Thr phosphatase [Prolixibacteraceae bacterium]
MKVVHKTYTGRVREHNEDYVFVDKRRGIFILADGMGGHQAGEIASELAVKTAYSFLVPHFLKGGKGGLESETDINKLLLSAMFAANDAVLNKAKTDLNLMGMGTTLIIVIARNNVAHICHVGDSRVYLIRDGIKQITKDHTLGDYLVEHKLMTREQVPPQKWHTLTQAVGTSKDLAPELNPINLLEGDILLLCSDGLTDMLSDGEIQHVIQQYSKNLNKTVNNLIKEANGKGGRDNISIVLIQI